jgi:hypothetical protein
MKETPDQIKTEVRQRFVKLAVAPQEEHHLLVGPTSAKWLGYDAREIDALPRLVTESFAGVGNPLALGELQAGETVLDLGSGAGLTASSPPVESVLPGRSSASISPPRWWRRRSGTPTRLA